MVGNVFVGDDLDYLAVAQNDVMCGHVVPLEDRYEIFQLESIISRKFGVIHRMDDDGVDMTRSRTLLMPERHEYFAYDKHYSASSEHDHKNDVEKPLICCALAPRTKAS